MKIMIVDDENDICEAVAELLANRGHETVVVSDGAVAVSEWKREKPDLILLDVMLPNTNGFDLCKEIRRLDQRVPIIMLSAKSDLVDKSVGFSAGCDDYIAKPFSSAELLMRVEAALRRAKVHAADAKPMDERAGGGKSVVKIGDLEVRLKEFEVRKSGQHVDLTPKEFQIVALLANHPGSVFNAQEILDSVWGDNQPPETTSVAVFIRKIRRKIEDDPSKPKLLQTVWHEGYRLGDAMLSKPE